MFWRIFNRHHLLAIGLLLGGQYIQAQSDSLYLTVGQLFDYGIKNSLRIQADRLKEMQAGEAYQDARKNRLPDIQIGLKGGFLGQPIVFEHGLTDPTYPETPDWQQNYAIDLNQPIYQGGKIRQTIHKKDIQRQIASLQTESDQAEIKLGLLQQYIKLFSYYKQHEVLSRNIEKSERRLKDIRRLKREGVITNNDVLRSELQLTNDKLALKETENTIAILSQNLDILLGFDESLYIIPDTALLAQDTPVESYQDYVDAAYSNAPEMKLARKQISLAQKEIELAKAGNRPQVTLYAANTLARPISRTMADMYNNNWNIGLSVSYPISALYKNKHKINDAILNVHLKENEHELLKQQTRLQIRTAFLRHQEAIDREKALELSVRQAQENFRIVENRYLSQLAILTDLLDANNVLLDAELQLTTARTNVIYTYYELQKACGRI